MYVKPYFFIVLLPDAMLKLSTFLVVMLELCQSRVVRKFLDTALSSFSGILWSCE
jgi:hypothetical protein